MLKEDRFQSQKTEKYKNMRHIELKKQQSSKTTAFRKAVFKDNSLQEGSLQRQRLSGRQSSKTTAFRKAVFKGSSLQKTAEVRICRKISKK
jgi:hypothetical protein